MDAGSGQRSILLTCESTTYRLLHHCVTPPPAWPRPVSRPFRGLTFSLRSSQWRI